MCHCKQARFLILRPCKGFTRKIWFIGFICIFTIFRKTDVIAFFVCLIPTPDITRSWKQALTLLLYDPSMFFDGASSLLMKDLNSCCISTFSFYKLMHVRLYSFLEWNNILYENQFGFRKQNPTVHALIQITEKISEIIENGKYGCGIFIDLRKAFDTVNHEILLKKLEHYGIRGTSLKWFQSYLSGRKQYVYFNGESSDL